MKQLKFLMLAFTLLMGVSLTSCMGDSDPNVDQPAFLKLVSTYPVYVFQYGGDGLKVNATNSTDLMINNSSSELSEGDIVYLSYHYNTEEQPITNETKSIDAKITIGHNCSAGTRAVVQDDNGADYENATVVSVPSFSEGGMFYYDKNTLISGVTFLAKESLYKHDFTLVYDRSAEVVEGEEDILKLYLRHRNNEEKPTEQVGVFKAYDISECLDAFGKTPTKIRIYANETDKSGSCSLDDAKSKLEYDEIEYKSVFGK